MRTGVTPENFISSAIRSVASEASKSLESSQKASFLKYTELEQLRFSEYFDRLQTNAGIQTSIQRLPLNLNRTETARELTNSRRALAAFDALKVSSCGKFVRSAALAAGIAPLAQFASGATAWARVESCASEFKTALGEKDKLFLIEAEQNNNGATAGMSCDQFDISSQALDKFLLANPGTYSPALQNYLCSLGQKKLARTASGFESFSEIQIGCNQIELPGSSASFSNGVLKIQLKSGGNVTLPLEEGQSWNYSGIRSSKPAFQDSLIQKVRHPMISSGAKKQILTPEYSCATGPAGNGGKDLTNDFCETSKAIQAWNHFAPLTTHQCTAEN
jgi:hypothetical protein